MTTQTKTQHKLEVGDEKRVMDLLLEAFSNPNFKEFEVRRAKEWPTGTYTNQPKEVLNVTIETECNQ